MKMPSEIQVKKAGVGESKAADNNGTIKMHFLQDHFARVPSEKILPPPRGTMNMKFHDEIRVVKTGKLSGPVVSGKHSVPLKSSKPWPGRKAAGVDELVKHMSNVPAYLQRAERVDSLQEKALNFGVLEWGLLERWTCQHKHPTDGCSAPQKEQFPSIDGHQPSSVTSSLPHLLKKYSDNATCSSDSATLFLNSPRAKREEEIHHCTHVLCTDGNLQGTNGFALSEDDERIRDHPQQNVCVGCMGFDSPACNNGKQSRFAGEFPEYIELTNRSSHVPYSCPLPFAVSAEEPGTAITEATRGNVKKKLIAGGTTDKRIDARKLPNQCAGLNQMSRSSSMKEAPSIRESGLLNACSDKFHVDKASPNSKGRRSPLRRMLDPLVKTKIHFTVTSVDKPPRLEATQSLSVQRRSVETCADPSDQIKENRATSDQLLGNCQKKTGLLQLAWKNGLPLFMLSSRDCDVLAATVRQNSNFDKDDDLDSIYTIFTVQEARRKSGVWIKPGGRNKKQQLVSNIAGEIRVSCSKSRCYNSKNHHDLRQFVLVASESTSASHDGSVGSRFNTELAAIVTKGPQPTAGCPDFSALNTCSCSPWNCLQTDRRYGNSRTSSVVALIPSGVHGSSSSSGEPSPLIERWRLGGSCDCGGWDEGCMLTILADDSQRNDVSGDGTRRLELFPQGRSREDCQAFSMLSFREGLYTVEFERSIALIQAFAICIAMLHNSGPAKQQAEAGEPPENTSADHKRKNPTRRQGGAPASYVPYHPPLSPVGRA